MLVEKILMIGFAPAGEVIFVEAVAGVTKPGDDLGVGDAVLEQEVDLVADGWREFGDFAGAAAVKGEGRREKGEGRSL